MNEPITLNHISELIRILNDPFYEDQTSIFDLLDEDEVYDTLSNLTDKQYNYILYWLNHKRWLAIKQILIQVGLKIKQN